MPFIPPRIDRPRRLTYIAFTAGAICVMAFFHILFGECGGRRPGSPEQGLAEAFLIAMLMGVAALVWQVAGFIRTWWWR